MSVAVTDRRTRTVKTTCPRDCYDTCGITATVDASGGIKSVRGDVDHPVSRGKLCRKCATAYNGVFLDPAARLTQPRIRTGPKGSGEYREASWDEALSVIADRWSAIIAERGAQAITCAHYTGSFALLSYWFPLRLLRRLGVLEVDPDTICNKAGHVALEYLYGTSLDGFDPRTVVDSNCVLVWGANPSASAPHQNEHWLQPADVTTIVVDPIRTGTAATAAMHLQLRPGTDAALAFAMLHVIRRDGLLDEPFLNEHTSGWDEVAPELTACTPEWGEQVTGVPGELIVRAARVYARGPSLLWIGQGLQRQPRGGNIVRSIGLLPAATGNLGRPGTGFLYLNGAGTRLLDEADVGGLDAYPAVPEPISHMDLAEHLEDPERASSLVCFNINIASSNPDQQRLAAALAREDLFTVVADTFATDTVAFADVVLPSATFLESNDLVASYFHQSLSAQVKVAEPPGEALPNTEIFRRLASAMGLDDPFLHEDDLTIIERLLVGTGAGLDFAALSEVGTIWPDPEPVVQFADLRFPTPSGKVELASSVAEEAGHGRIPLPTYDEPPSAGSLRLLSPASSWMLNATFSNEPRLRRRQGEIAVAIHPDEASARGVADADRVVLSNATGVLRAQIQLDDRVPPRCIMMPKGRWLKLEPDAATVNVLNPSRSSDYGESATFHGTEVTLTLVDSTIHAGDFDG